MSSRWLLVLGIVVSTVLTDLLQSGAMKRHGEINEFRPSRLGRIWLGLFAKKELILSIVFMAASFFCFLKLLEIADLSFAVPATAGTIVIETVLAKLLLKEQVNHLRWAGAFCVAAGVWLLAL